MEAEDDLRATAERQRGPGWLGMPGARHSGLHIGGAAFWHRADVLVGPRRVNWSLDAGVRDDVVLEIAG